MTDLFKTELNNCNQVLLKGGIILYPTDTIWGIGCDATNETAVEKILKLKQRIDGKSLVILLDHESRLLSYVQQVPDVAIDLVGFAERPLTIIYDQAKNLAKNVIAEDGSVGIRITRDEFCKKLIEKLRKPIVSTSANVSGKNPPQSFDDIDPAMINGVDYVVNLRQQEKSKSAPSTIIRVKANGQFQFIRK